MDACAPPSYAISMTEMKSLIVLNSEFARAKEQRWNSLDKLIHHLHTSVFHFIDSINMISRTEGNLNY